MTCQQIEASDLSARYVAGQLDAAERNAYEDHYFECAACFDEVQLQLAMRTELSKPRRRSASSWMTWGAIAALLVLALSVGWYADSSRHPPVTAVQTPAPPPDPLVMLARVEPPPYQRPSLRGARTSDDRFREAMDQYVQHNYPAAIAGLSAADPKSADTQFFLGVCYLLQGDPTAAIERLTATIKLGETLDLEPARFYLAKAYLQRKDVPAAIHQLESTLALHGDLEPQ